MVQVGMYFFPFDIFSDTPIDVAKEMVKELEITDWEPYEIATMIEGEISLLLQNRRKISYSDSCHTFNYQDDDDDDDDGPHQHFHFVSSCSSPKESISGLCNYGLDSKEDEILNGYYWNQDDTRDDARLRCSSQGTYSNLNYYTVDDQENNVPSTRKDKHPIIVTTVQGFPSFPTNANC